MSAQLPPDLRRLVVEALADADAALATVPLWGFGPQGFGPYDPAELEAWQRADLSLGPPPLPPPPKIARPRAWSKQGRRERGGLV